MKQNLGKTEKDLIKSRQEKLEKIIKLGYNPYPSSSGKEYSTQRIVEIHKELIASGQSISIAGRMRAKRGHGKLVFIDLWDESGKIQAILKSDILKDNYKLVELLSIGDFVEARGKVTITKTGEVSLVASKLIILSKAVRPLPDKWHGIVDEEIRFRKRYLDLMLDTELREIFVKKAKFWQTTRNFLIEKGFLEVETPTLETTCGGADANPFLTHHDALDIDLYLRISMGELWQKRLLVGGFDKTFEIGRQFRNEGISREHLQDYSQMEFYWAYANYEDSMKLVEKLYKYLAKEVFEESKFEINGNEVDINVPWKKIDYVGAIKDKVNIDVLKASSAQVAKKVSELKLPHKKSDSKGRMVDTIWKSIRGQFLGPAFLVDHPVEVSPLAKRKSDNPKLVERFQIIIGGSELGNGYTELNDPADQKERFSEQAKMREAGDREAQMSDDDFVEALEYGMPPATGFGFSERLFAVLMNKPVRECVMFPLLRPKGRKS